MNDLTQLTEQQLKEELKRRKEAQAENRKAYKELVNESLPEIIKKVTQLSYAIAKAKLEFFQNLKFLLDSKNEAYKTDGTNQSHSFTDDQGNTIIYGFRVIDNWDDTVTAGIEKVRDYLQSLAKDENSAKLVKVIQRLLKQDSKGNLKASRVIELTKLAEEINNEQFTDAVHIILSSYKPQRSAFFIEAYTTDAQGKKQSIPLSITSVDFPAGTDIDALFPVHEKFN